MLVFWVGLLLILLGGVLALLLNRNFMWLKLTAVVLTAAGSLTGLGATLSLLNKAAPATISITYLHLLSLSFKIDGLAAFFLICIFGVALPAVIYSFHYMHRAENPLAVALHYLFFSLLIISMALLVSAADSITFMLFWELMSLSSFFLVIHKHESADNRRAGYLYLAFSQVGAMFLLAAFGLIYGHTGTFGLGNLSGLSQSVRLLIFILAVIGFGSKAGVFPLHVWLPQAHPAAPSPVSAVMSGVMIKTGIYGILRMYALLNLNSPVPGGIMLIAGIITGVLGGVYALGQQDLKRLLAYSSMENIGIILIGLGLGMLGVSAGKPIMAAFGFVGGLLHVLNHAAFKSLLFMAAGMVQHSTGTLSMDALGGLLKKMRLTGIAFLMGSLAIAGLPPFNGFISEFLVYFSGFHGTGLPRHGFVLCLLAIVSLAIISGLALAVFTKALGVAFQGEPRSAAARSATEKGWTMLLPMSALAGLCLFIGLMPKAFIQLAVQAAAGLNPAYGGLPLEPFMELIGQISRFSMLFLMLLILLLALRSQLYQGKTVTKAGTWGCGFTRPNTRMQYTGSSFSASILAFFRPLTKLTEDHPVIRGRFPGATHYLSKVNDLAEMYLRPVIVNPVLALFDKLRWIQHGDVHLYIGYILLTIVVLLFFV